MKKVLLTLSILSVTPVFAQTAGHSYLALDLGSATYSNVTVGAGTYPNPGTFSAAYGYQMTDMSALELGITGFGDSTLSGVGGSATTKAASVNAKYVATFPLNDQFALIGNAGLGFNKNQISASDGTSTSDSATSFIYGVGAKFKINQRFALLAQYENYGSFGKFGLTGKDMTATTFTVGGRISF